jgi:hypothetical protein
MNNLQKFSTIELSSTELVQIEGGNWFSDVVECHGMLVGFVAGELASAPGKWLNGFGFGFNAT